MKRTMRVLFLVLSVSLMLMLTVLFASAAENPTPAPDDFFQVTGTDGTHFGYYKTFDAALAAVDESHNVIVVLQSATVATAQEIQKSVTVKGAADGITLTFEKGQAFNAPLKVNNIPLDGYYLKLSGGAVVFDNITLQTTATEHYVALYIAGPVQLTLRDTVTDGFYGSLLYHNKADVVVEGAKSFLGKNTAFKYVVSSVAGNSFADGSSLTVRNGTISNSPLGVGGDMICIEAKLFRFTMTGGMLKSGGDALWPKNGAIVEISQSDPMVPTCIEAGGSAINPDGDNTEIRVSGGTFTAGMEKNVLMVRGTGSTATVSGGTFTGAVSLYGNATLTVENITLKGYIYANGKNQVTIQNGTFENSGGDRKHGGVMHLNDTGAKVTIQNGTFTQKGASALIFSDNGYLEILDGTFTSSNVIFTSNSGGTCDIRNGKFTASSSAPAILVDSLDAKVNIYGGIFEQKGTGYLLRKNNGILKIYGGEFTSPGTLMGVFGTGVYTPADEQGVTVTDGTFRSNGEFIIETGNVAKPNMVKISGGTFTAKNHCFKANGTQYLVENGTFTATNGSVFYCYDNDYVSSVTVKGGSFETVSTAPVFYQVAGDENRKYAGTVNDWTIAGGYFSAAGAVVHWGTCKTFPTHFIITDGAFDSMGDALFHVYSTNPVAVFEVTGGRYSLNDNFQNLNPDAAIISTKTAEGMVCGATIRISGGLFMDERVASTASFQLAEGTPHVEITTMNLAVLTEKDYCIKTASAETSVPFAAAYHTYLGGMYAYVYMQNPAVGANAPQVEKGASVRVTAGSEGIRFTSHLDAPAVAALKAQGEVQYGTLIVPVDFAAEAAMAGGVTVESLDALAQEKGGTVYLNVPAVKSLVEDENGVSFNAVLIEIKANHYNRGFLAVPYALVNGTYYYGGYNTADNARTPAAVAAAALADVKDTADAAYPYPSITVEGKFSKYTEAQQNALKAYLPKP